MKPSSNLMHSHTILPISSHDILAHSLKQLNHKHLTYYNKRLTDLIVQNVESLLSVRTICLFHIRHWMASGYSHITLNSQLNLQLHHRMTSMQKCLCNLKRVKNEPATSSSQLCTHSHGNKSDNKIICICNLRRWVNIRSDTWEIQNLKIVFVFISLGLPARPPLSKT